MRCEEWSSALLLAWIVHRLRSSSQVVEQEKATHAAGLVKTLLNAKTAKCRTSSRTWLEYRTWTDPLLQVRRTRKPAGRTKETPCQPRPVAGGRQAGRLPLRPASRCRAA